MTLFQKLPPWRWIVVSAAVALGSGCAALPDDPSDVDEESAFEVSAVMSAPTITRAVAGDGQVTLTWTAGPTGSERFQLRYRPAGGSWSYRSSIGRVTTYTVSPLTNDTRYEFQVRIKGSTAETTSAYSAIVSATPGSGAEGSTGSGSGGITDECDGASVRHITVTGAGTRDGRTLANAGTISSLSAFVSAVGPGGQVCIHAGTYRSGHVVTRGGAEGAPVVIKGVGGRPIFESTFDPSTRAKWGPVMFEVRASNLVFHNLEFRRVGTCFRFGDTAPAAHVTLSRFRAVGVATCVDVERNTAAAVSDLTVRDAMILQFTRGGIFLASNTDGALIEDAYIDMQPSRIGGRGSDYPVGIAFYDETRNVVVRRATVMNVIGMTTGYTQGDGIDAETSASDIVVENSYFRGSQDGCIDTKARNMLIRNTVAAECKRNYRIWQYVSPGPRVENVASYQPVDAHFFIKGGGTTARNVSVYSSNSAELVAYDCSSTTPCPFDVAGITGTLATRSDLNATGTVTGNTLAYGRSVVIPPVPNPTSFTP